MFIVEAASIPASGSVVVDGGKTIHRVQVNSGSIFGAITANSGRIRHVEVVGGDLRTDIISTGVLLEVDVDGNIGAPGAPVSITTFGNGSRIDLIRAESMYAEIATPNTAAVRGDLKQLITTTGVFSGSLTTFALQGTDPGVEAIDIAGDLDGVIFVETVKRPITIAGKLLPNSIILASQDLKAEGPITIETAAGLEGQVIIADTTAVLTP